MTTPTESTLVALVKSTHAAYKKSHSVKDFEAWQAAQKALATLRKVKGKKAQGFIDY